MIRQAATVLLLIATLFSSPSARADSTITEGGFHSDVLDKRYPYMIYLPEGYHTTDQRYPVVYLLHGSFGGHRDWQRKGRLKATVDRMIRQEQIEPVVIVMPGSRSWWVDGHNERAGTAFLDDLMPHIQEQYRVVDDRQWRAVAGLSAGGYGAINFMMSDPDRFAAAAAFSPAIYDPLPPSNSTAWRHPSYVKHGMFDPDLWERRNYTAYIEDYLNQQYRVPLYLTVGDRDPLDASDHTLVLKSRLEPHQQGLVERQVLPGGHTWGVWRSSLPEGLRFLDRYLRAPLPTASD